MGSCPYPIRVLSAPQAHVLIRRCVCKCAALHHVAVYVMLAMEHEFEGMMIAMQRKKLLDDGEYFLIGVDSKPYDPSDPQVYIEGWHRLMC